MIDWESMPDEYQSKYKFDSVRMMCNHMIDDGENVSVTLGPNYNWSVVVGEKVFISGKGGEFDELVKIYEEFSK